MNNMKYNNEKYSGPYLGVVRSWMQRKFRNGEHVDWGSDDILEGGPTLTPYIFETLACEIRDAVLREFGIKDKDHVYKYTIFCHGKGKFKQRVDTSKEAWTALFALEGSVLIVRNNKNGEPVFDDSIFQGDIKDARQWVLDTTQNSRIFCDI